MNNSYKFFLVCFICLFFSPFSLRAKDNFSAVNIIGSHSLTSEDYGYGYDNTIPAIPENFLAVHQHSSYVTFGWSIPSQDIHYYKIKYGKNTSTKNEITAGGDESEATINHLKSNKRYFAKIRAVNEYGSSSFSDLLSFRTAPKQVQNVQIPKARRTSTSCFVAWHEIKGKKITYRLIVRNQMGKLVKQVIAKKNHKVISGLSSDTLYKIKVRAVYKYQISGSWSKVKSFYTLPE